MSTMRYATGTMQYAASKVSFLDESVAPYAATSAESAAMFRNAETATQPAVSYDQLGTIREYGPEDANQETAEHFLPLLEVRQSATSYNYGSTAVDFDDRESASSDCTITPASFQKKNSKPTFLKGSTSPHQGSSSPSSRLRTPPHFPTPPQYPPPSAYRIRASPQSCTPCFHAAPSAYSNTALPSLTQINSLIDEQSQLDSWKYDFQRHEYVAYQMERSQPLYITDYQDDPEANVWTEEEQSSTRHHHLDARHKSRRNYH